MPPDAYFTMGDNRSESCDSRTWGGVTGADVIGKVVKILARASRSAKRSRPGC
jgi:type IV secretory pathway protease TraF